MATECSDSGGIDELPQLRQNKATRDWVIYSPARAARPHDLVTPPERRRVLPRFDPGCPFCPGNERSLAEIIAEIPNHHDGRWQTRIVCNRYPALVPQASTERNVEGIYLTMGGHGRHEVIIETPRHDLDISQLPVPELRSVIEAYHQRYVTLMTADENMFIMIFRNHGERAGTSLIHPHSQLIVTPIVPTLVRVREERAQRYFDEWGRCVFCDILAFERRDRSRVIFENAEFLAFVPFAAEVPFEIWIVPSKHQANFGAISERAKDALAEAMHDVLGRLCDRLADPDYNYLINSSPQDGAEEPHLHWYLQIRPRCTNPAGFEIGTGISINASLPESDAACLNRIST